MYTQVACIPTCVCTRVAFIKPAYTLRNISCFISLALTGIPFYVTFELTCRNIIFTSLTNKLLSKGNSSNRLPSRTTYYIIMPIISPFELDDNHVGVWSPQLIDISIINIIQTPSYSPPLTSRAKGGSIPKQGFSFLVERRAL